jgi:hypothetical protein
MWAIDDFPAHLIHLLPNFANLAPEAPKQRKKGTGKRDYLRSSALSVRLGQPRSLLHLTLSAWLFLRFHVNKSFYALRSYFETERDLSWVYLH